jgi:hypothetical protein
LNSELNKNLSFVALASELFRYTESYSALISNGNLETPSNSQSLISSNLILDFTKDLNIREVHFLEVFDGYKKVIDKLNRFDCFNCPQFIEHVN